MRGTNRSVWVPAGRVWLQRGTRAHRHSLWHWRLFGPRPPLCPRHAHWPAGSLAGGIIGVPFPPSPPGEGAGMTAATTPRQSLEGSRGSRQGPERSPRVSDGEEWVTVRSTTGMRSPWSPSWRTRLRPRCRRFRSPAHSSPRARRRPSCGRSSGQTAASSGAPGMPSGAWGPSADCGGDDLVRSAIEQLNALTVGVRKWARIWVSQLFMRSVPGFFVNELF